MIVILTFDTEEAFTPRVRTVMERYFRHDITAYEAGKMLGWERSQFEHHMANLFSLALNRIDTIPVSDTRFNIEIVDKKERVHDWSHVNQ